MNVAYNLDCMDAMRKMPDHCFDLAVVDPPYGIGHDGQKEHIGKTSKEHHKFYPKKGWDTSIPDSDFFCELERVSVNQIIWGGNYFLNHLHAGHRGWLVWDKGQRGLSMSDCELAYTSFDCPTRIVTFNRMQIRLDGPIHPTQKPVALYAWIYAHYAHDGDKILDTHLGSGSSRIAAYNAGLDFVGFEIDKEYYAMEEERYNAHTAQLSLFV